MSRIVLLCALYALLTLVTASPTLTLSKKLAVIRENTAKTEYLSEVNCSDPDNDPTTAVITNVSPSTTACGSCFVLLTCPTSTNKCLQYKTGQGTLDYSITPSYLFTIECRDNKETPDSEVVEVRVIPNSPPYFDPYVLYDAGSISVSGGPTTIIKDVNAIDPDGDTIEYSMVVSPSSSSANYKIDKTTGVIKPLIDMRKECRPDISFSVYISDGKNKVGPLVIDRNITGANVAPIATNLNTIVQIPETTTGTVFEMVVVDNPSDTVTFTTTADNTPGFNQFTFPSSVSGGSVKITAAALDYEKKELRETNINIQFTDGYCTSPTYKLTLRVIDVNEPPSISPTILPLTMCEGKIQIENGFTLTDPDESDYWTWSFEPPRDDFQIDPQTGAIKSVVDYDLDKAGLQNKLENLVVKVKDKGYLPNKNEPQGTATVALTLNDCNDNAPVFDTQFVENLEPTECTPAGTILGSKLKATDKDSSFNQNNVIEYSGSGGAVAVNANGDLVVLEVLPAGTVLTFEAYAFDKGKVPGPLKSKNPCVVSVAFKPCPTTPPPVVVVTATPAAATTSKTSSSSSSSSINSLLPWIIVASIAGAFMLGLLIFMVCRYGQLCGNACKNWNCGKDCCRPKPKRQRILVRSRSNERIFF
ncbi:protocadherin-1-like [Physella acuta]|uniref:protocadherin-1-like n=1 Tax=Physella acuta TaxID=109671 RepID=UPI0027DE3A4F|nr:protocadherin-1-like [Physella acuta]XP_059141842.1 protocadherin-1-like [Physella acuta]